MGFPDSSVGKESACKAGDPGSIPGSGRSPGKWIDYPLQYSWASLMAQLVRICLQCGRPGFKPWVGKIPWRREGLPTPVFWSGEFHGLHSQSMGSQRVGHDCTTFSYIHPSQTWNLVTIDQKRYKASLVVQLVKNLPASVGDPGDVGSIPGLGRSPGEGNGNPLQYSCLENSMNRGAWWARVHGVMKNLTQLSVHTHTYNRKIND